MRRLPLARAARLEEPETLKLQIDDRPGTGKFNFDGGGSFGDTPVTVDFPLAVPALAGGIA